MSEFNGKARSRYGHHAKARPSMRVRLLGSKALSVVVALTLVVGLAPQFYPLALAQSQKESTFASEVEDIPQDEGIESPEEAEPGEETDNVPEAEDDEADGEEPAVEVETDSSPRASAPRASVVKTASAPQAVSPLAARPVGAPAITIDVDQAPAASDTYRNVDYYKVNEGGFLTVKATIEGTITSAKVKVGDTENVVTVDNEGAGKSSLELKLEAGKDAVTQTGISVQAEYAGAPLRIPTGRPRPSSSLMRTRTRRPSAARNPMP